MVVHPSIYRNTLLMSVYQSVEDDAYRVVDVVVLRLLLGLYFNQRRWSAVSMCVYGKKASVDNWETVMVGIKGLFYNNGYKENKL